MTFLKPIQVLKLFDYTSAGHVTYAFPSERWPSSEYHYGWSTIFKIGFLLE